MQFLQIKLISISGAFVWSNRWFQLCSTFRGSEMSDSTKQQVEQSNCLPVHPPLVTRPYSVSQPRQPVSQPFSPLPSQPVSQSVIQPANRPASHPVSQSVSQSASYSQSVSQSVGQSVNQQISQPGSQPTGQSVSRLRQSVRQPNSVLQLMQKTQLM